MPIPLVIFSIIAVLFGIYPLYMKYRIVINGELRDGTIIGVTQSAKTNVHKFNNAYYDVFVVRISDKELPALFGTLFGNKSAMEKKIGHECIAYFNPNHPTYVVLQHDWTAEFIAFCCFLAAAIPFVYWIIFF